MSDSESKPFETAELKLALPSLGMVPEVHKETKQLTKPFQQFVCDLLGDNGSLLLEALYGPKLEEHVATAIKEKKNITIDWSGSSVIQYHSETGKLQLPTPFRCESCNLPDVERADCLFRSKLESTQSDFQSCPDCRRVLYCSDTCRDKHKDAHFVTCKCLREIPSQHLVWRIKHDSSFGSSTSAKPSLVAVELKPAIQHEVALEGKSNVVKRKTAVAKKYPPQEAGQKVASIFIQTLFMQDFTTWLGSLTTTASTFVNVYSNCSDRASTQPLVVNSPCEVCMAPRHACDKCKFMPICDKPTCARYTALHRTNCPQFLAYLTSLCRSGKLRLYVPVE
jgi:hypothetical protein